MSLPKDFMEEFNPLVEKVVILGNPLDKLTRKELQATVAFLIADLEEKRNQLTNIRFIQSSNPWGRDN